MDCRFNRNQESAMKNSSSPLYKGVVVCDEDLTISFHKKKVVKMQQCWAVGFSILEISKYFMQNAYYNEILPRLGGWQKVNLVLTDTDSFILHVANNDMINIMHTLAPIMDFANYGDGFIHGKKHEKKLGYFKNEVPFFEIVEVVALRSKTYVLKTDEFDGGSGDEARTLLSRAKGVTSAVKALINFEQYASCLKSVRGVFVTQHHIRSKNHVNQLISSYKMAFSSFDDKRFLLCEKHSVPYGSAIAKLFKKNRCYFCPHPMLKRTTLYPATGDVGDNLELNHFGACLLCQRCECEGEGCGLCMRRKVKCRWCGKPFPGMKKSISNMYHYQTMTYKLNL